jgi:hypothetical protein
LKAWDRIRDGLEDFEFSLSQTVVGNTDVGRGKISDAAASPQSHPALPQIGGEANSAPSPKPRRPRRPPGAGEIDVHVRIPARFRDRLQQRRRELGTSLTGAILELVRRGLEEPPPGLRNLRQRDIRQGVVEEAALATLLAVEQVRLELEMSIPKAAEVSESTAYAAAIAAEQRLLVARQALGEMKR